MGRKRYIIGRKLSPMALMEWELHSRVTADLVAEAEPTISATVIMHRIMRANPQPPSSNAADTSCINNLLQYESDDDLKFMCTGLRYEGEKKWIKVVPVTAFQHVQWGEYEYWTKAEHMRVVEVLTAPEAAEIKKGGKAQ